MALDAKTAVGCEVSWPYRMISLQTTLKIYIMEVSTRPT